MGQAKKRGTQAERVELAIAEKEAYAEKWHLEHPYNPNILNKRRSLSPLLMVALSGLVQ